MIKAEQIPPEVVEAAARDIFIVGFDRAPIPQDPTDADRLDFARASARAAIAAALAAWPNAYVSEEAQWPTELILPLPTEARDELRPDRRTNVAERLFGDD